MKDDRQYNMLTKIYDYKNFTTLIEEGLIKTYPLLTTNKLLSRFLGHKGIYYKSDYNKNTNTIFIKMDMSNLTNGVLRELIITVALCGYFPSTYEFYDDNDIMKYILPKDKLEDIEYINITTLIYK